MHWDMEGVCGLFRREQVWFWQEGVPPKVARQGQDLLIADVNNAVEAALAAGVDELIVCDTHHGGGNIIPERMLTDERVTYLCKPRGYQGAEYRWLPGLDESVDGFMVPGHHAMAGTQRAFLPHTWMGFWSDFSINGQSVGEMGIEACFAAHWNVPLMMMSGDQFACAEAKQMFPGITTACVKTAVDHDNCTGPDLDAARKLVARAVTRSIENLRAGKCVPFAPELPMTVTIRMKEVEQAETAAGRPGVERVDEFTVRGRLERRCDVVNWVIGTGLNMSEPKPESPQKG